MDKIKNQILKELLPAEKDVAPAAAKAHAGGKMPALHSDHWTSAVLLERAAYLHKLAKHGDGSAGETLKEYPRHCAMLSFRSRDGEAEAHENFADVFYVLEGRATLVTGGTIVGARVVKPGETRGDSIEGGARQEMRAGDVAHVPAGLPHQMLVAGEQTVTCLVVKVEEKP
jgi:mannose-6-phosphate isomerase-like protein (cupin superfamily)